jgi:hypothetical protein
MPRKIKVVDVVPDNDYETAIDSEVQQLELVQENNEQTDTIDTPKNDEIQSVEQTAEIDKPVDEVPKTKIKTNELHECPKCGKFMTLKTLKYTHEKTCCIEKPEKPKKEKPEPKPRGRPKKESVQAEAEDVEVEETQPPEPVPRPHKPLPQLLKPVPTSTPGPTKSFEEMRRERLRERVALRSERIQKLFSQAF